MLRNSNLLSSLPKEIKGCSPQNQLHHEEELMR